MWLFHSSCVAERHGASPYCSPTSERFPPSHTPPGVRGAAGTHNHGACNSVRCCKRLKWFHSGSRG